MRVLRQLAEAGIDAVDRIALADDGRNRALAGFDGGPRRGVEHDIGAFVDGPPEIERHLCGHERERRHQSLPRTVDLRLCIDKVTRTRNGSLACAPSSETQSGH